MNMNTEPIRLPAWATAVLAIVLPPVIALLLEQDWKVALATSLGGLLVGGGIVAKAESARAFTNSPATVERNFQAAVSAGATGAWVQADPMSTSTTIVTEETVVTDEDDLGGEPPIGG